MSCSFLNALIMSACAASAGFQRPALMKSLIGSGSVSLADGFGGAVTASLFLEKFTSGIPWVHFDIYSWADSAKGPFAASGGTGQVVQAVAYFLREEATNQA